MENIEITSPMPVSESAAPAVDSAPEPESNGFSVPDAYKNEKWAQNIKDYDGLFKEHANLQSLLGKRPPSVPSQDASPEEWQRFVENTRPQGPDEYTLKISDEIASNVPDDVRSYFEESAKPYAEIMHNVGLSKWQAQELYNQYIKTELAGLEKMQGKESAVSLNDADRDTEFMDIMGKQFGDKATEAVKVASVYTKSLSPEMQQAFDKLPNDAAAAVVELLYKQHTKFNSEGSAVKGATPPVKSDPQESAMELGRINARILRLDPHQSEYRELKSRAEELREQLRRAYSA